MNGSADLALVPGRVSLIVPCYNVEAWFGTFLESVLEQTYRDLEVILVNDGANEATTGMLRDAVPKLEAAGFVVKLIEQENKGLGGAVDTGLKHFTGEFLMWPDPDDWFLPHSIERRVALMRQHPEVGLLRSNARLFIEAKQAFEGHFFPTDDPDRLVPELFEELVFQRSFYAPVCHMVRSAMFLEVHSDRCIWHSSASSQNFQLLVPFVESFPVLQVHEPLGCYRIREDSRSRGPTRIPEKLMGRHEQLFELMLHTIPKLRTYTPERAERLKNQHWRNKMLPTAIRAKMKDKGLDLIGRSALAPWRKALARGCLRLRCNRTFDAVDARTGRIASRALARSHDALVRMPAGEAVWGAGPLWPGRAAGAARTGSLVNE